MQYSCSSNSCSAYQFDNIKNNTIVSEFILLGFNVMSHWKIFFFYLVLLSYILIVMGNFIILYLVLSDLRLHFPMYYFLCNLAFVDIIITNAVVPGMLKGFAIQGVPISVETCLVQLFIYFLFGTAAFYLYAVMSFDRYLAICHPLRYAVIMHRLTCIQLIAGVWLGSFFTMFVPFVLIMKLRFCYNFIDNFFCDIGPLLKNSCTDTSMIELISAAGVSILYVSILVTVISYVKIILEVMKIDSPDGRRKTLSTCSSHAISVTLAYSSCIILYAKPEKDHGDSFNKKVAILNTVVVPLINPFVYTLRNRTVTRSFSDKLLIISCQR